MANGDILTTAVRKQQLVRKKDQTGKTIFVEQD